MKDDVSALRSRWTEEMRVAAIEFLQGTPVDYVFPTVTVNGVDYTDLRGIRIHMEQLDFAVIKHVNLRWSTIEDVGFKDAKLIDCNLSHVTFKECYFRRTQFIDSDIVNGRFDGCDFSNALIDGSRLDFATFKGCEIQLQSIKFRSDTNPLVLVRICRNLKLNAMSMGHFADAGELTYLEKTYDRKHLYNVAYKNEHDSLTGRTKAILSWLFSAFMNGLWGYAEKPGRLIWAMIFNIILFGTVQYLIGGLPGRTWWEDLYFSGITFMTVGYGDMVPVGGVARLISVLEGGAGVATTGLLIASATKKIMYR